MLPRAALHDRRRGAGLLHAVRALAWWRTRRALRFTAGHCVTAGALHLTALTFELATTGRPLPSPSTALWAGVGLAMIAVIPALLTVAYRTVVRPATRIGALLQALVFGVAFYAMLPLIVLGTGLGPIALLVPIAVAWHTLLGLAPPLQPDDQAARA